MRTYRNGRNEAATTDGRRWWRGTSTDAATVAFEELQPVSALFPPPSASPGPASSAALSPDGRAALGQSTVAKARAVFISALRKAQPTVKPADDTERAILRKAWDDATAFAATHRILAVGQPVFDAHLMVVGTADVVVSSASPSPVVSPASPSPDAHPSPASPDAQTAFAHTFCYAPPGYEFAGELNALVRILHAGLPDAPAECPHGLYALRHYARAVALLVMRDQTAWHKEMMDNLPF